MKKKKVLTIVLSLVLSILFTMVNWPSVYAADVTVNPVEFNSQEVQKAVDAVEASGGGTVYIPAGDFNFTSRINVEGNISVIGAGLDKTKIHLSPTQKYFFVHTKINSNFVRYSGISLLASDDGRTSTVRGIELADADNFRIDHIYFEGAWHGVISLYRVDKGLIDNCSFFRTPLYAKSTCYGVTFGSPWQKPSLCGSNPSSACLSQWAQWWDDPGQWGGVSFKEPYDPGTDDAVFIEDCHFFGQFTGSIQGNWGNRARIVARYNHFENETGGVHLATKPGTIFVEAYNNTFEKNTEGQAGRAVYARNSGIYYNNTFKNLWRGGELGAYNESNGFRYTSKVIPNEIYIFDNTYVDTLYGDEGGGYDKNCPDCCRGDIGWQEWCEGAPTLIAENQQYFFRAPQSGERLYDFVVIKNSVPSIRQYPYPHPLQANIPNAAPSPPVGLKVQ